MRLVVAFLVGASVVVWFSPPNQLHRLRRSVTADRAAADDGVRKGHEADTSDPAGGARAARSDARRIWVVAAGFGLATTVVIGGWIGVGIGAGVGILAGQILGRLEPRAVRDRRARLTADLPLVAELLAACLRAGRSPERAVEVVAWAITGPLGVELALVAEAFRLGARADAAWGRFLAEPALARFGRAMVRAWHGGAPLADILDRLADDARRVHRAEADRRARAVGVQAALPLGLCFLPAFLLVGVVPLVAATITDLLR